MKSRLRQMTEDKLIALSLTGGIIICPVENFVNIRTSAENSWTSNGARYIRAAGRSNPTFASMPPRILLCELLCRPDLHQNWESESSNLNTKFSVRRGTLSTLLLNLFRREHISEGATFPVTPDAFRRYWRQVHCGFWTRINTARLRGSTKFLGKLKPCQV